MTVQERMAFVSFSHQFSKRLMMMKLCHSKSEKIANLATFQLPLSEYMDELCSQLDKLRFYHFLSKAQAAYLHNLKDCLKDDECIVLLDFAENYSYVVEDDVQVFHWNNSHVTSHSFVAYYKEQKSSQQH